MSNAITKTTKTNNLLLAYQFQTKDAANICNKIVSEVNKVAKSSITIGKYLTEIKANKLHEKEGFEKFSDFVEQVIGFKSSQSNRFMQVYTRCTNNGVLPEKLQGFNDTVLGLIAQKAPDYQTAEKIVIEQNLKPNMPTKEIENKIKPLNTAKGKASKQAVTTQSKPFDYETCFNKIAATPVFTDIAVFQNLSIDLIKKIVKAVDEIYGDTDIVK